jgi:hypothetical protein
MESVYTRGDLVKNFPAAFQGLEDHFSSEYAKVTGCQPDRVIIQSLANNNFRKLWQILRKKDNVLTSPRGQAFLSVKLPVPVAENRRRWRRRRRDRRRESRGRKERRKQRRRLRVLSSACENQLQEEGGIIVNTMRKVVFSQQNLSLSLVSKFNKSWQL